MGKQYGRTGKCLGNSLKMLKKVRVRGQKLGMASNLNTQFFILGLTLYFKKIVKSRIQHGYFWSRIWIHLHAKIKIKIGPLKF